MAGKTAILSVRVVSDTKDAQRGAAETATAWEKFETRLNKASIVAAGAGAVLVKLGSDAYKAASDLQQSTGAVETVFKDQAGAITRFAETAWESVGLSQNKAQEMATIMGSQLKNMGVPMDQIAGQSEELIRLGADLAATYGGDTSQAVEALSSLLRGERDPIERYGVTINQAMLNAEKAAMGLDGLTGAADRNADMQATLALLTKQTADAQGQFSRETDTAAGAAQRNAARWETVQAQLGTKLLPILTELTTMLIGLAGWVADNSDLVFTLAGVVGGAAVAVLGLNAAIKTARLVSTVFTGITSAGTATVGVIGRFIGGMKSAAVAQSSFSGVAGTLGGKITAVATAMWGAVTAAAKWAVQTTVLVAKLVAQKVAQLAIAAASRVAAIAQGIWNAVMNANPIMLIITIIIAAILLLVMNWETVQQVAVTVWEAITAAALWLWETVLVPIGEWIAAVFVAHWLAVQLVATAVWDAIVAAALWLWNNVLVPIGDWIAAVFVGTWTALRIAAILVWNGIKDAGVGLWNWLKSIGDWIAGVFRSAWDGLRTAGTNALNAIISPVRTLIGWLKQAWDWVQNLFSSGIGAIGDLFGFSARVEVGAPVTAAAGSAPRILGFGAGSTGDTTVNINIELPQYVGDRNELLEWLQQALTEARRRSERLVTA